jgi:FkbM family methyltransferase
MIVEKTGEKMMSRLLHAFFPTLWHWLKYQQYLRTDVGEREIRYIGKLIPDNALVIDVGVHLGFYSRHFARFASEVLAFEANPASAREASRLLPAKVKVENVALSDTNETVVLRVPLEGAGGAEAALGTLAPSNELAGAAYKSIPVTTRRLDSMALPTVGLIKIDVEGHEEAVLRGALGIIQRDHPRLMIEIEERHNEGAIPRVFERLGQLGYRSYILEGHQLSPIEADQAVERQRSGPGNRYLNNFFFLPR